MKTLKQIEAKIRDLEAKKSARLEVININKETLHSQVNRIKYTITKTLTEDPTLGERIKTLFREQGIKNVSVLTAIGMIIGVVEAVISTSSSAPTPKPTNKSDVKDWVKKQLTNLRTILTNLAGKAATALSGIIGSIVS